MPVRPSFRRSYSPPRRDSERAVAQATLFLLNARSLEGVTPDELARRYSLSLKRAEYLLTVAVGRRGDANPA